MTAEGPFPLRADVARRIQGQSRFELPCEIQAQLQPGHVYDVGAFTLIGGGIIGSSRIGRFCSIGWDVVISPDDHPTSWLSSSMFQYVDNVHGWRDYVLGSTGAFKAPLRTFDSHKPVEIGNDVWLGQGVFVRGGVRIGDGAIVAARSVVVGDVAPYQIVGGNPARPIRMRFADRLVERLMRVRWWRYEVYNLAELDYSKVEQALDEIEDAIARQTISLLVPPVVTADGIVTAARGGQDQAHPASPVWEPPRPAPTGLTGADNRSDDRAAPDSGNERPAIAHYWRSLPGPQWFSGAGIYAARVAQATDGAIFVELGGWKGRSAAFMGVEIANSGKRIKFYSVDHWRGSAAEPALMDDEDVQSDRLYEVFLRNVGPVSGHVLPVRSDSAEAAEQFQDRSIDFVYLDASHTYEGVTRDMQAWWPKLKVGGTIAGDNWCYEDGPSGDFCVRRAVTGFFSSLDVEIQVIPGDPNPEWEQWLVRKT